MQIAFNPQYLLDGISAVDSDTVRISFTTPTRPAVLTGKGEAQPRLPLRPHADPLRGLARALRPARVAVAVSTSARLACTAGVGPSGYARIRASDPPRADGLPLIRGRRRVTRARVSRSSAATTERARPTSLRPSPTWRRWPVTGPPTTHRSSGRVRNRRSSGRPVSTSANDALVEIELNAGRANRVRLNRAPPDQAPRHSRRAPHRAVRARGSRACQGRPRRERRRFLDDLLVAMAPRYAAVRADYERVVKQRTALLKSAGPKGGPKGKQAVQGGGSRPPWTSGTRTSRG